MWFLFLDWGTGVRELARGLANETKVGNPEVSKSMECDIFPSVL